MTDNLCQSRLLADLPFDVLLKIFSECGVEDVLNLSTTCKRLNQASGEHRTWLDQVTRLQIPIPTGISPLTPELKNWAISWVRSEELWVKPRDEDEGSRSLSLHSFNMRQEDPDEEEPTEFIMANLIPGGEFVVILYTDGQIDLKEIKIESEDEWNLQDVAQYKHDDSERFFTLNCSQLLTETKFYHPLVAYVDEKRENLLIFLVDHVAGIIEQKQVVKLDLLPTYGVRGIHARGNAILCFYDHGYCCGWGITVSELGPNPALKSFTLSTNQNSHHVEVRFFMVSENAVVLCDTEGILLYHIPELSSTVSQTLSPVWEWSGESRWFCGSVRMMSPQHPVLYLQGASGTHTITFHTNTCGRDPVVVKHHITGKLPAHLASVKLTAEGDDDLFVMKGRKGLYYGKEIPDSELAACLLGREELTGRFGADLELPGEDTWGEYNVTLADFDERTGRILIGVSADSDDLGIRIYLADLPP